MAENTIAKLTYFDGRGRAESIRFMLAAAGIPFTESFITDKEQWEKLKSSGKLLFNQVPMLEIDGLQLVQTVAITCYIARKYGMDGKSLEEKTRIDILTAGGREFIESFLGLGFLPYEEVLGKIKETTLPKYLPVFEKILSESSSGYLVGDSLTFVDVTLFEAVLNTAEFIPGSLDDYPKLQEFKLKLSSLPNIKAFLEGPQRKQKNSPEYVSTVISILYS